MNYGSATRRRILSGAEPEWLLRHPRRAYVRQKILATPDWCDRARIAAMARDARRRGLVLDHIVPITHHSVCGLHVPDNLRAITPRENAARSNRWWEFTPDLFAFPQQLRLL